MKKVTGLFLAIAAVVSFAFVKPGPKAPRQINVVIDAAHGGNDFGMTVDEFTEKQIVNDITNKIKVLNTDENVILHFTRVDDSTVSLTERTDLINKLKPDLVISLHVNGNQNAATSGFEMYVGKDSAAREKSFAFAEKLNTLFVKNHNFKSRGIKEAPFYLLNKTEVPSIIVELGFLSNENDKRYLTDEKTKQRIAATVLELISGIE